MVSQHARVLFGALAIITSLALTGCGGGGGGSSASSPSLPTWVDTATEVPASVALPSGSPIADQPVEVEVFDRTFSGDDLANLSIKIAREVPSDAYIMLPERPDDEDPTVYLFTTVFPGDSGVTLDAENTAISLVMNAIPRYVLEHAADPQTVRQTIRTQADAFIQQFIATLEADPYCLRSDNLDNVYDATYVASVTDSYNALKSLLSSAPKAGSRGSRTPARPAADLGGQFAVTPAEEQEGFRVVAEFKDGDMTGNLFVQNDTRLYAHFRVITTTNDVIKDIPKGLINTAYSPEILGSQASFWGGFLSTEQKVETGFRNVTIDVETPGLLEQGANYYTSSAPGLMARSTFANFLLPVVEVVLPVADAGQAIFAVLGDAGVFDDAVMQAWQSGDVHEGLDVILGNITKPVLSKVIEKSFEYSLEHGRLGKLLAKLAVKLTAVEIMGAITAVDLAAFKYDLENTHAYLRFNVVFPITLDYMTPSVVDKESAQPTEISVHGQGLGVFTYDDTEYSPEVVLTALDRNRELVDARVLEVPDVSVNGEGTQISFYIPRAWMGQDDSLIKNVDVVDVKIRHHYIQPGTLVNSLESVELPATEPEQEDYRVDLTSGLMITGLSKAQVQGLDVLEISGSGFAEEAVTNEVYLVIRSGYKHSVTVDYVNVDRTLLKVTIPSHEELVLVGKASLHVELPDGTVSNTVPLDVIPERVTASPDSTAFDLPLTVTLSSPQAYTYILYSIDGGVTEQVYTDALLIDQSTTVFARAQTQVEGVAYDSEEVSFTYTRCADGQMAANGECVRKCSRACDDPQISSDISIPGYMLDAYGNNLLPHTITLSFDDAFKWCTTTIIDPEFYNGEKHMLYFYRTYQNPDGSWNKDYADPDYGFRSFTFGKASVDATHDYMKITLFPKPTGYTQATYYDPENFFGMVVMNYDNGETDNGNDYMEVRLGDNDNYYYTIINPEMVEADGCYEGDQ